MKRFALVFLLHILLTVSAFPQNSESARIAFIIHWAFGNEESGIKILAKTLLLITPHHHGEPPLSRLAKLREQKIKELENKDLTETQKIELKKSIAEITEEFEATRKLELENYEKRKNILLKPILDKIDAQIKSIAEQNNLIIPNIDEVEEAILSINEKTIITEPVISALNDYFKTSQNVSVKIDVPQSKIAFINTKLFLDESKGIKRLVQAQKEFDKMIKSELGENPKKEDVEHWIKLNRKSEVSKVLIDIGKSLQNYSIENGFTLILDSSQKIPDELKNFPSRDVTNEFISYYNLKNQ